MLKRLGILFFTIGLMFLGIRCEAQSQFSPILTKMETSLFGIDYNNQNDTERLKRIEEVVYGQTSSNSFSQRVDKLSKDLCVDLIGQQIKPKRDTFEEEQAKIKEVIPKADSNVNYPVVNELEKNVFNKEFRTIEINQRLASLEQNVFKKTYTNDSLNTRVDRLKQVVLPDKLADDDNASDDSNACIPEDLASRTLPQQDDLSGESDYNSRNSVLDNYRSGSDVVVPLAALEKKVLRKTFPDDTVSNRLSRLELNIFNSTFTDDDQETRIDRIASAYQAKKTSQKYDSNKFAQHMAAAMQVGAIVLMILAAVL